MWAGYWAQALVQNNDEPNMQTKLYCQHMPELEVYLISDNLFIQKYLRIKEYHV